MRMRRKKHLTERLANVGELLYTSECKDRNFNTAIQDKDYIDTDTWFGRSAPLYLEIGCGKGGFAVEYARRNPEINLLAVERDPNVIVSACEAARDAGVQNLKFLKCSAEYIERHLHPRSISGIFLNFSCPFPKNKYASHRLTSERFLEIYKHLLLPRAEIHQKTDNMKFFEFSIEQFSKSGYIIKNVSLDLANSGFEDNIVTEYEARFLKQGLPIYRLEAYLT